MKILRSIHCRGGREAEAVQQAKAIAAFVNKRFPTANVQVFSEVFGKPGTLYWIGDIENAGAMENLDNQLNADPEWPALLMQGDGMFVDGSLRDTLLRSL
jgi:hypothetical protein